MGTMNSKQKFIVGETVIITNPASPKYNAIGKYAGLADTYSGNPQKYRIIFNGKIYLFHADDFILA